ncbi:MAG TPA: HAD-IB family phosphatase [Thermoplasmata archaeon]|nr:HAD-IB family phosphatase [Thermoplasmata archaeon]
MLKLVPIDMDGTLVDVESSWAAVHHYYQDHNADGLRDFLAGRIDDHEFIRSDVRIWRRHAPDISVEDLEGILAAVPVMPGARRLVDGLHAAGARTAILSGGIDLLARRVARDLGIDIVLANGFRVTADGRLTGEGIVRVPIYGKEKVLEGLQHQLGVTPAETASIGNSEIDIGMFRRSKVGVAFLPADDAVRAAATHVITEKDLGRALSILDDFR